jgi:hypothetical protein
MTGELKNFPTLALVFGVAILIAAFHMCLLMQPMNTGM